MGFFDFLFRHPKPKVPPAPPPPRDRLISVDIDGPTEGIHVVLMPDLFASVQASQMVPGAPWHWTFRVPGAVTGGADLVVLSDDAKEIYHHRLLKDGTDIALPVGDTQLDPIALATRHTARQGLVRVEARSLQDDGGAFWPLGTTLMWALYGWMHGEQARVRQHFGWAAENGFDYLRILCQTPWQNETIDPLEPGFEQALGALLDCAYDEFGLRLELTLVGGGAVNPLALAAVVARVVANRRVHKVLNIECANESFQNLPDPAMLAAMCRELRGSLPASLPIALSSPGDWAAMANLTRTCGANLFTVHSDRQPGDLGWRQVRQAWDFKDPGLCVSNNEPPGPASSVAALDDPLQLAALRALGIICGAPAFVLHCGAGVYGRPFKTPTGFRPANLWEVPNIDAIVERVRGVDRLLPEGVENWPKSNNGWVAPNPRLPLQALGSDWSKDGPNKTYGALQGANFCLMALGVRSFVKFRAEQAVNVRVHWLGTGASEEHALNEGDVVQFDGEAGAHEALVIEGQLR
jgi:hypothetical protein